MSPWSYRAALFWVALAAAPALAGGTGLDEGRKAIALNFYDEPRTLDQQKATDNVAMMILGHTLEGLTRLDAGNRPIPAQAESWERVEPTRYVFTLRRGAKWSDGKDVTPADFIYAWRRAVDPKTHSEYTAILYPLKNAQAICEGKLPVEKLGIRALDDRRLEVTLERPTEYFLRLLALATYFPTRADVVAKWGDAFAADADKMVANGPFVISRWEHNQAMTLSRSETYWNRAEIALSEIAMPAIVRDKNAEFQGFKDGRFALTWSLTKELLPSAKSAKLQLRKYNDGTVWYFQFNTTRAVTGNKHLRKAIQLALNREEFVRTVQGIPGSKPIYGIVPEYMPGVTKRYGEEFPLIFPEAQLSAAKAELALARKELGGKPLPPLNVLASDSDNVRRDVEYFRRYLKDKLGLELVPDFQPFKVRLERTGRKEFDIVNSGWGPDYLDAMTFADLFTSWNGNNATGWSSRAYDGRIEEAMATVDPRARLAAISAAERVLVDEAPVVPYFQEFRVYVQDPRLIGVLRRTVGADPDFYYAKLTPAVATSR